MQPTPVEARWLGRVDYREAWALQKELALERARGEIADTLLLLEHPPVYTTGRRGAGTNLRLPPEALGAPLVETDRGGEITFHGPGQLIGYSIMDVRAARLSVVDYVRSLEQVIIRTIEAYGVVGGTECGLTGVWVGGEKLAAIGVRVGRPAGAAGGWVTTHGFALNVDVDLAWFERIVPCGVAGRGVTSLARLLAEPPTLAEVAERVSAEFGAVFGRPVVYAAGKSALTETIA